MSKASLVRLLIGLAGSVLVIGAWLLIDNKTVALFVAGLIYLAGTYAAERCHRMMAPPDEIRADLEDRVRNPPA